MKTHRILLLAAICALGAAAQPLAAATRTWTGNGANANWTTAANWGGTAPVAGDDLVFPFGALPLKTNTNDFPAGTSFHSIAVQDGNYFISGNQIALQANFVGSMPGGASQFLAPLSLAGTHSFTSTGNYTLGDLSLAPGATVTFDVQTSTAAVQGSISGGGALQKTGAGTLKLGDNSAFTGPITATAGVIWASHSAAFGTTDAGTTLTDADLQVLAPASLTIPESLVFQGAADCFTFTTDHTLSGPVTANTTSDLFIQPQGGALTLSGVVQGPRGLNVLGNLVLGGTAANTFAGQLEVAGALTLAKSPNVIAVPGTLFMGINHDCTVLAPGQLGGAVTLRGTGSLLLNGHNATVTDLSIAAGTVQTGAGTLTVTGAVSQGGGTGAITGQLHLTGASHSLSSSGVGDVFNLSATVTSAAGASWNRAGLGKIVLGGGGDVTAMTHAQGVTIVNSAWPAMAINLQSGTIGGTGSVSGITKSSIQAGTILPGDAVGRLSTGAFTFNSATTLEIELNGVTQGSGYDALLATGATTSQLGGANLNVTLGPAFVAPVNMKFRVVEVLAASAPGGTFTGKANNSTFTVGAYTFRINYFTGTGNNDIELTVTAGPFTPTARTWSGAGGNALWTNPANWSTGVAPVPGDNLTFPTVSAQLLTTNDFPAGTFFNAIILNNAYTLSGNAIALGALTSTPGAGNTAVVQLPVDLAGGQTINAGAGTTDVPGALTASGGSCVLNPSTGATLQISGQISGGSAMSKPGAGILVLQGNNSFTGDFTLTAGTLQIGHAGAMGPGGSTRLTGGSCSVSAGLNVPEALEINSACTVNTAPGNTTLSGAITTAGTAGTAATIQGLAGGFVTLSGVISGPRGLSLIGGGTVTISGGGSNTFAEFLSVDVPVLHLGKTGGASATAAGTELRVLANRTVNLAANDQISGNVLVKPGGLLNIATFSDAIPALELEGGGVTGATGTLTLAGPLSAHTAACSITAKLHVSAASAWTIADPGSVDDLTVSGGITGAAGVGVTRGGPGRLVISGASTLGAMQLDSGATLFNGTFGGVVTLNGGLAGGTGAIGQMLSAAGGGTISPGASPGSLELTAFTLNAATTTALEINGTAPGSFDRITSNGACVIAGTLQLTVAPGTLIAVGSTFRIVENTANLPGGTSGTFTGLANNATITGGGHTFRVNYGTGTGGDDVELTLLSVAPTGNTRTWTGSGANNNWTTAANWDGGVPPVPGDALLFPAGAARTTNTNDFVASASFASITINAVYNLSGNSVVIESLAAGSVSGNIFVSLPLTFAGARAVTSAADGLFLFSAVQSDGGSLTFTPTPPASIGISGAVSGSCAIVKNGSGFLALNGDNTFTGDVTVNGGVLSTNHVNGLAPGGTTHLPGGTLQVNGNFTLSENFVIYQNGKISRTGGAPTLSGSITTSGAAGDTCYLEAGSGGSLTMTGAISGPVKIFLEGSGGKTLSGTAVNTMTGAVTVGAGTLTLARTGGGVAIPAGTDLRAEVNATVTLGANDQIGGTVLLKGGALLNLNNFSDSIAGLALESATVSTGAGTLTLAGPLSASNAACTINGKLRVDGTVAWTVNDSGASDDLTINAAVSGINTPLVVRGGNGRLVLTSGASTLGNIRVTAGDTAFNGTGGFNVEITGGEMSGAGSVLSAVAKVGGVIAPGNPGPAVGTLGVGAVEFQAGSEAQFNLSAAGHDQIGTDTPENKIGGDLQLSLAPGYNPAPGAQFILISNVAGAGALNTGTFSGKPEGAVFAAGGKVFRINYQSGSDGDNDDVMLTCVTPPPPKVTTTAITDIGGGQRNVQLGGTGVIGAVYIFEEGTDLINWTPVTSTTAAPTTGAWSFNLNRPAPGSRMFFRARMQ